MKKYILLLVLGFFASSSLFGMDPEFVTLDQYLPVAARVDNRYRKEEATRAGLGIILDRVAAENAIIAQGKVKEAMDNLFDKAENVEDHLIYQALQGVATELGIQVNFPPSFSEQAVEEEECAICLEKLGTENLEGAYECKHEFHKECAQDWLKYKPGQTSCPVCRANLSAQLQHAHQPQHLIDAVALNQLDVVDRLLAAGANVNAANNLGITALGFAISLGRLDIVNRLLAVGPNVNSVDNEGKTALMRAVEKGCLDIVNRLLAVGANVNSVDNVGKTALMRAAMLGRLDVVNRLLGAGANVNTADTFGRTALMIAAMLGRLDVVNKLLASGANVNSVDNIGKTALTRAVEKGHLDIVNRLRDAGADLS